MAIGIHSVDLYFVHPHQVIQCSLLWVRYGLQHDVQGSGVFKDPALNKGFEEADQFCGARNDSPPSIIIHRRAEVISVFALKVLMDSKSIGLGVHSFEIRSFEAQSLHSQQFFDAPIQGLSGVGFNEFPQNHISHIRIVELSTRQAYFFPFLNTQ